MSNPDIFSDKWLFERTPLRLFLYCLAVISVFLPNYIYYSKRPFATGLSSLLSCGCKGRGVEARNNIGALNRAQQAYHYHLEQHKFTYTLDELGMGISTETVNYSYRIVQPMAPVSEWKQPQNPANWVMTIGQAKDRKYEAKYGKDGFQRNSYIGYVYTTTSESASSPEEVTTKAILCEQKELNPRVLAPWLPTTMPAMINGQMECPTNYKRLGN